MASDRILIVDDDPDLVDVLTELLRGAGFEVAAQDSVFGARALVRQSKPALILLDIGLPFRSGLALLDEMKADPATSDVPIVILSGMTEALTAERRARADAVLSKPFEISALMDAIGRVCSPEGRN